MFEVMSSWFRLCYPWSAGVVMIVGLVTLTIVYHLAGKNRWPFLTTIFGLEPPEN